MPDADIIRGTIIGDIIMAIMALLNGTCDCDKPIAASVPNETDSTVAIGAILNEFFRACCQS
jgi:hypothetical protein